MIWIENVSKTYQQGNQAVHAVKDANLHIRKGEIFGIIGYSGAGKSSLLRCINYLERPTVGVVRVNGTELAKLNEQQLRMMRRKIGMIFQNFNLLMSSTVYQNIAAPLVLAGMPKKQVETRVSELLSLVGLEDKKGAFPAQLSGGQKQRVAIARALANEPEILLCDEATSALDPQTTDSILNLLQDIHRAYGITIVLITHEMYVVKKICDRVAVMEDGLIVEQGTVLELFTSPKTDTTKKFTKSVFDVDLPQELLQSVWRRPHSGQLLRISFVGETVSEPILADLTVRYQLRPSILYGNITKIKDTVFGCLIISLPGDPPAIREGIAYMASHGMQVEVLEHAG
ncbi:methionine ABC transporter ATP-binding protein [Bacillus sp. FJAT-26390]|uniref:methionine ABC transporter ATP-binding protein n=1 Tax=Bacillus sp. FJAT-26390 TaxID=1743142 RepID=UPI000807CA77|nr:ATP-binding cassette domain-containing protein [Bacillus sp. FJAT-26390]OBZ11334.1 methionine ABC transporter ATP-binding protein [Bacillus sp. FJAT-26390]